MPDTKGSYRDRVRWSHLFSES